MDKQSGIPFCPPQASIKGALFFYGLKNFFEKFTTFGRGRLYIIQTHKKENGSYEKN